MPAHDPPPGRPPSTTFFNAHFAGTQALRTELAAQDPDGDLLGVFFSARLRDGALHPANGAPDMLFLNYVGELGEAVPDLSLVPPYTWDQFYAVIVYLIDAEGNFTRLEDDDLFR